MLTNCLTYVVGVCSIAKPDPKMRVVLVYGPEYVGHEVKHPVARPKCNLQQAFALSSLV